MKKLLACATLAVASISTAHAASVLDQSNFVSGTPPTSAAIATSLGTPNGVLDLAEVQFVTAGMSGLLAQVNLQLGSGIGGATFGVLDNIVFDSNKTVSSYNLLGSLNVNPALDTGLTGWTSFDTSSLNIFLSGGQNFALALIPNENVTTLFPWARGSDTYAGGDAYLGARIHTLNNDNDYVWSNLNQAGGKTDFGFQTFVAAVPEPSTWTLMLVGFGAIGFTMRRRRNVTADCVAAPSPQPDCA